MSAARKSSSTEREADAPKPGQRTSGWRQSRCALDSHYVTNHTLTVREGVITQSRAKSPGAPQTSTLSLCLIEQFNVMLGTVPRHSIRYPLLSSTFSLSSARRFPTGLTHRAEGTANSHILFWMKWPTSYLCWQSCQIFMRRQLGSAQAGQTSWSQARHYVKGPLSRFPVHAGYCTNYKQINHQMVTPVFPLTFP